MPRFFENPNSENIITGENANHIANSLRMKKGEHITLCNNGIDFYCEITEVSRDYVKYEIISKKPCENEPGVTVTLFQCVPKSDKLEFVIQKAVELGADKIVPVLSSRCVSRPDEKSAVKKQQRYNKIALQACLQSERGKIVEVAPMISFDKAVNSFCDYETAVIFYEGGGERLTKIIAENTKSVCILVGPEGGLSEDEVAKAVNAGAKAATLGNRILRTETAPLAALTAIMLLTGNM